MKWVSRLTILLLMAAVCIYGIAAFWEYKNYDGTMPVLTFESDVLEIPCSYSDEQLLMGVTAYDEKDGDITGEIIPGNFTRFIEPGVSRLTYFVFDSDENMAAKERKVRFTDYYSPRFHLTQPLCFTEDVTDIYLIRDYFTAEDMLDGDLTQWITYEESNADTYNPGSYTITMSVRNSYGDIVTRAFPIHIFEKNSQTLNIALTEAIVYLPAGGICNPSDYVSGISDNAGNQYDLSIMQINSMVNTAVPGMYEICYIADTGTGLHGEMWLTVIVEEAR